MNPVNTERPRGQQVNPTTARITVAGLAPIGLALVFAFVCWDRFVLNFAVVGYHRAAGQAHFRKGEWDKAVGSYTAIIDRQPSDARAHVLRGSAYEALGDWDRAIKDYTDAIRLAPQNSLAYNDLAWLLATSPLAGIRDGKRAVQLAQKACALDQWKHPSCVDTLAAAFAEVAISNRR
jgi:tetratricopeptide (TPR) repeat protein